MHPVVDQLNAFLSGNIYLVLLVFARTGTALMLMPGLGDNYTPARMRLLLALGISVAIAPLVKAELPPEPKDAPALFVVIAGEAVIGAFLGTISLIFISALETGGQFIAQQVGLSSAYIFNPQSQTQGSVPGTMLTMAAVVLIFATDMYQVLIKAIVESYHVLHYDSFPLLGDLTDSVAHLVSRSFLIGFEISSPFVVVGLMLYAAFGLIGRLLPQIQIFFITLPLQIGLGLILFGMVVSVILRYWLAAYADALRTLGMGG